MPATESLKWHDDLPRSTPPRKARSRSRAYPTEKNQRTPDEQARHNWNALLVNIETLSLRPLPKEIDHVHRP